MSAPTLRLRGPDGEVAAHEDEVVRRLAAVVAVLVLARPTRGHETLSP